ncbi:hypothetical protein [Arenibaculum pallidiluteum]|uniref:hypothetical protein n=1 Tax=Arenibaculum pallidiluteum TaxID=2812559 RepID=UPI001A972B79|nr:hypothetical protein [Arenibaculum pallidiluteum]
MATASASDTSVLPDPRALAAMDGRALDALFRRSPAGAVPHGRAEGLFLLLPGTRLAGPLAGLLGIAWRGKDFDAADGSMVNRVTPLGVRAVPARVRAEASRMDGRPCHVLDYTVSSRIARAVRDEIREVAPGLYLGQVYWHGIRVGRFALRFPRR